VPGIEGLDEQHRLVRGVVVGGSKETKNTETKAA
jgi:hypothetical protein